MAHEIDTTTGKAAVFVTGQPAWHRLGTVISEAANSSEAIKLAGLDWQVQQFPIAAQLGEGKTVRCPNKVANVRTDTNAVLGVVGGSYRVFQNSEAFDFMDALVGEQLAMYETAGSLKEGRRVWMLARIPQTYRIAGDDIVKPYVLLTNAHDGTQALRMLPTTVRVVCNNTLNLAVNSAASYLSIWHTDSLQDRVNQARRNLGIINEQLDQFVEEARAMVSHNLSISQAGDYFRSIFPTEGERSKQFHTKALDKVLANFDNVRNTLPGIQHTAWAAYNAVSEWADHDKTVRGNTDLAKADSRLNSIWFGSANKIKQQAWQEALALVA